MVDTLILRLNLVKFVLQTAGLVLVLDNINAQAAI